MDHDNSLSQGEIKTLAQAKEANPHWFSALIDAAEIMTERRQKYAGKEHPYFNFVDMARRMKYNIREIFRFYINLKASRLTASQTDFEDERVLDTYIDIANYALIAAGWEVDHITEDYVDSWSRVYHIVEGVDNEADRS